MRQAIGRLVNNELENSGVAMFFDARRAMTMDDPDRSHELQKILQLFTDFSLICLINFKFAERRKAGFLTLIISFFRLFYCPLGLRCLRRPNHSSHPSYTATVQTARKVSPSNVLYNGKARPQVADGEDVLQIRKVAVNI
jgi:hypothetical protein